MLIKRVERNKRKYVTAVSGLEAHGLDLKKVAKEWGKKFATGSSVTKSASGSQPSFYIWARGNSHVHDTLGGGGGYGCNHTFLGRDPCF